MLTWLACTWEREGIETDLRSRAEAALESSGFGWGEVTLDGRDAFLTGTAPDDAQPYRAQETVRQTHGVRIVRARTDAADPSAPPAVAEVGPTPQAEAAPADIEAVPLEGKERKDWEARWAKARENERRWRSEGLSQPKAKPADDGAAEQARAAEVERQRLAEVEATKAREAAAADEARAAEEAERKRVADAEAAKAREAAAAEELRAAEEAERKRVADAEAAKAREAAAAEEARAAEAERQRQAKADAEKAREAAAEDAKRRKEETARAAEAERQRLADEREQAEADAEAQRLADEQARAEEAAEKKRQAEAKAAAAARAKQQEQDVAVARQKDAEEAKRKAEADHCQGLMRSAMAEGVINFARAKSDLTRDSYLTLDRLAGIVKVCPTAHVNIAGHTDSEGEIERNQGLSERRAKAVADYLIGKGVESSRLTTEGFGKSRPLAPNDTPEGMRQNRRIEFSVTPAP